ncbi:histidine kinase dimerization/phosphoacceptor domain -containing protein [Pseudoroseicyclus tamaricis]|uniref:Two-component sensor histidine kinase n=1 Tax=Pseudoroseicyclus tamaricis TaxID=2705421 RepID=A0A6B2JFD1_9RHOB|nr:histidine kinase dimerization/phosphoacceptor domain -containing protein [Pseudoroseicyclus tamaricis]NDU99730.1 hypothetical protein [Pseudoroseicyclus tamaricis]
MLADEHPLQGDRLDLLEAYGILDTEPEEEFDSITRIAAAVCKVPTALISFVSHDRQWFKSRLGCALEETGLESSICSHAILGTELFEVQDTQADARTVDNPLCQGEDAFRFYAGVPIVDPGTGLPLGSVCVLDTRPRELTEMQKQVLGDLALQAMRLITLRNSVQQQEMAARETDHRIKNSLQSVASHIRLQVRMLPKENVVAREALQATEQRLKAIATLHEALCYSGTGEEVDLPVYLGRILRLSLSEAPMNIRHKADLAACKVDPRTAAALGTLVNEMAVNAVRHAFPGGQEGTICLTGHYLPDGHYELTCSDDGIGLPETPEPVGANGRPRGLGHAIIESMLQQLGAPHAAPGTAPGGGTSLSVPFRPTGPRQPGRTAGEAVKAGAAAALASLGAAAGAPLGGELGAGTSLPIGDGRADSAA